MTAHINSKGKCRLLDRVANKATGRKTFVVRAIRVEYNPAHATTKLSFGPGRREPGLRATPRNTRHAKGAAETIVHEPIVRLERLEDAAR